MTFPMYDLDEIAQQMDTLLPPLDLVDLCCCHLIDPSLEPNQHLEDCELAMAECDQHEPHNENNTSGTESDVNAKRRKQHRESMARLRKGWRASIAALSKQAEQLQRLLQRMAATYPPSTSELDESESASPLETLRRAYRDLVVEQTRLETEHASLEAALAHREKYERMLQRELERVRVFNLSGH